MKFSVLALDYDGTIARKGKTHSTIVEAIREARGGGITVILVTGRILRDCHTKPPVDLELAAYLLVTYRPSQLSFELVKTLGSIIVTPLTDPGEIRALAVICEAEGVESEWATLLGDLVIDEAVLLPAKGSLWRTPRRFTIAERITSHVRHRAKYLDVPMPEGHAFVFTYHGQPVGKPARTLKEFGLMLERLPIVAIEGDARRGDFSRWIGEVLGDQPLAVAIAQIEEEYRHARVANLPNAIARSIRGRYELES